jgi:uncharacterized membrane protein
MFLHLFLALVLGVLTGLRTLAAPTAASIAARSGRLDPGSGWLSFLRLTWTPWILVVFAIAELIGDQLPSTPSRTVPLQFGARIVASALAGAAVGQSVSATIAGAGAGTLGAVIGTLGGRAFRGALANAFGRDRPAAFIEDAVAYGGVLLALVAL